MTNVEALELLKQGDRVSMRNDKTRQYYQCYSSERIYQMIPKSTCSASIVAIYSAEQFLQTVDIDFILYES